MTACQIWSWTRKQTNKKNPTSMCFNLPRIQLPWSKLKIYQPLLEDNFYLWANSISLGQLEPQRLCGRNIALKRASRNESWFTSFFGAKQNFCLRNCTTLTKITCTRCLLLLQSTNFQLLLVPKPTSWAFCNLFHFFFLFVFFPFLSAGAPKGCKCRLLISERWSTKH